MPTLRLSPAGRLIFSSPVGPSGLPALADPGVICELYAFCASLAAQIHLVVAIYAH